MRFKSAILGCSAALILGTGLVGTAAAAADGGKPKPTAAPSVKPGPTHLCPPSKASRKPVICSPSGTPLPPKARRGNPNYTG